jgi:Putative transposase
LHRRENPPRVRPRRRAVLKLKKPFRDGTVSVEMDPLSLISRLAASVHPPRFHSVRYGGVLAPHSNWRPLIVPSPPPAAITAPTDMAESGCHSLPPVKDTPGRPPTHRCRYRPWHELMRRCLKIDVETCGRCGGKMRLVALVKDAQNIARYLRHLGLPTDVPPLVPARGPPFWQSTVLRRRYGEPSDAADA